MGHNPVVGVGVMDAKNAHGSVEVGIFLHVLPYAPRQLVGCNDGGGVETCHVYVFVCWGGGRRGQLTVWGAGGLVVGLRLGPAVRAKT